MPDMPSITVVKEFTYKGQPEEWSNTYHFSGGTPADEEEWDTLSLFMWNQERAFLSASVSLVTTYGYEAGNESSVYQADWQVPPRSADPGNRADADPLPGDSTVWVRWNTGQRNSKGRPIYGRKYYHGVPGAGGDSIPGAVRTIMEEVASNFIDGTIPGDYRICGPQGATYSDPLVAPFVGYRQLRRTGKRPTSG